jgi:hypothetical protein
MITAAFSIVLILVIALILKKLNDNKRIKEKQALKLKVPVEKDVFINKETEASEKEISSLQTVHLKAELASKKRELANAALSLVYKNEVLQKLSTEISKLKDQKGNSLSEIQYRKLQKIIDEAMNDERDWDIFESTFNDAHENFFKKLKAGHPHLVPNDLKLCAFLHMNMSSKEIASLLNISLRGVEIRRYRLRKKLRIPHDQNIVTYLLEV